MHFRKGTPADRDAILALREECFGAADPEKRDPRFWTWEFDRADVFVGELAGSLVTHVAMLRLPHMLDGRVVDGALAVDAMTSPRARGRGAFTGVVRFGAERSAHTVATAYQIRPAVLGAMLRGGWTVATRVPVLLRPAITLRGAPPLETLGQADVAWMSTLGERDGCVARTPEFLRWRFFENPSWRYGVAGIRERGYVVTRRTSLKRIDTLAVVDLAAADAPTARTLLRNAVAEARERRCRLVAALASWHHPRFATFIGAGFVPGPHWFRLLVHPSEQASRKWRVLWADTDHL